MKTPFFSIITCTKNSAEFIKRNVESVKTQTFQDFEQIFIDGRSKDETKKMLKKYTSKNLSKYRFYSFAPKGISDAFNRGIKLSQGKYVFFLNSDDSFYDNKVLEDIYHILKKDRSLDWIYGIICVTEADGVMIGLFPRYEFLKRGSYKLLRLFNYIPHQSVFMKKETFVKFGLFDESLSSVMDYDYWLRIGGSTKWVFVDRIISNFSVHKGSQSSSKSNRTENRRNKTLVQKHHLGVVEYVMARIISRYLTTRNKVLR